jgi:hypothetical protein
MQDICEQAGLKLFLDGDMKNKYALCTLIESTCVLPLCLLKYISEYCGTNSYTRIIEMTKSFDINKIYEVIYYSYDPFDILSYLNNKYNTQVSSGSMYKITNSKISFSYNLRNIGILNIEADPISEDTMYHVGYKLTIMIS